jgi:hypothetical protein
MGQFSDDGQWWWDGKQWIAVSQIVIPELQVADTEGLERMQQYRQLGMGTLVTGVAGNLSRPMGTISAALLVPFLIFQRPTFRAYRASLLEQVAAATAYLLGPDEPMVAGEVSVWLYPVAGIVSGDLAVAVTRRHVLVLWINVSTGRPQRVALAARPRDVNIVFTWGFLWGYPTVSVYQRPSVWQIGGAFGILQREPVLAAWRQALAEGVPAAG